MNKRWFFFFLRAKDSRALCIRQKLYSARQAAAERCDQPRGLLVTYRLQYCSARSTDLNARRKTTEAKAPSPSKINVIQKRKSELVITLGWIST